jgi:hypothetical protein
MNQGLSGVGDTYTRNRRRIETMKDEKVFEPIRTFDKALMNSILPLAFCQQEGQIIFTDAEAVFSSVEQDGTRVLLIPVGYGSRVHFMTVTLLDDHDDLPRGAFSARLKLARNPSGAFIDSVDMDYAL